MINKLMGAISKVVGAVAFIFITSQVAFAQDADVILHSGVIYTAGKDAQFAEAVAVKDGKFLTVGKADTVRAHLGDSTQVIDLKDGFVMPGIVDGHTHGFEDYHKSLFQLQVDESSPEALLRSVKHYAEKNPDKKWITGGGWPNGMFSNDTPTAAMLDEAVADRRDQSALCGAPR